MDDLHGIRTQKVIRQLGSMRAHNDQIGFDIARKSQSLLVDAAKTDRLLKPQIVQLVCL